METEKAGNKLINYDWMGITKLIPYPMQDIEENINNSVEEVIKDTGHTEHKDKIAKNCYSIVNYMLEDFNENGSPKYVTFFVDNLLVNYDFYQLAMGELEDILREQIQPIEKMETIAEKIATNDNLTLTEINEAQGLGIMVYGAEYVEGAGVDDVFTLTGIISPENNQRAIDAYVPVEMVAELIAEKATTETTQYHNWTATFPPRLDFGNFQNQNSEYVELLADEIIEKAVKEAVDAYIAKAKEAYPAIIGATYEVETQSDSDYDTYGDVVAILDWSIQSAY